ncbi:hypothetical protein WISP_61619 [Willisornis vidua]|uniref:SEFIR domain-containing protein n=1 Tax=Willisornis vidua TaxID=1566151 RepID=A0ABQ9DGL4_9PASS|nr:hypothetical protein WISP_61619 [Willisornis vidua]
MLLPVLPPGAALRLLLDAAPPFSCSQPDLNCLVRNSTCMDSSWLKVATWTPSAPSSLHVSSHVFRQVDGKLLPVLQIEWKVATDASIRSLRGAELAVMQVSNNQQICAQFDFQNNLPLQVRPDGGRWNFTFDRFEVEPGQTYQVTVYHLPKLSVNGDYNCKSTSVTVPGTDPSGRQRGKCNPNDLQTAPYTDLSLPPLKPRKVWIVYSADHLLYVDVVLKFAEFLMTVCGTAVALDLLEDHQISELGPLPWLTRQKKEMEDLSSKIIILCSRGTQAKWQAMLGQEPVCLKQDQQKPMGDLFTPALNLILPDFKKPACFGMYIVCYFEGISSEKDIPDLFNVTSRYQLMDKFEDIYFRIQDLEKFEPGRIHRIQEITAENYIDTPSGRKLKEAVQKFKNWQTEHPDWFECETICLDNDEELHSLNRESQMDSLLGESGSIVKHQLHLHEPDPNCCYIINLHMHEGESTGCKLQPQFNPCGDPASQTVVVPVDEAPLVQVVEPVSSVEDGNILSHDVLSNEDCMEGVPLLETSFPMRNNVILHNDSGVSAVADYSPANLSGELGDHMNGFMYPVYQQSVVPSEPYLCQEEADGHHLVFDDQCKDQRQSVQSDQGYISRCSPLPPDDLVEEEEEEEEDDQEKQMVFHELSPEVLNSLKSLQRQLFFQDIQRSCNWSYPAEVMDIDQSPEDC